MSFDEIFDLTAGVYFYFYNNVAPSPVPLEYDNVINVDG